MVGYLLPSEETSAIASVLSSGDGNRLDNIFLSVVSYVKASMLLDERLSKLKRGPDDT